MRKRFIPAILLAAMPLLIPWAGAQDDAKREAESATVAQEKKKKETCPATGDPKLAALLKSIREKHRVPAIAAAIVTRKGLTAIAAVGVRKKCTSVAVTMEDQWHLGSDTKAMTAALIAKLIEQERLTWKTTLAEAFPERSKRFHEDMKTVNMLHLLSHHAGLPANPNLIKFSGKDGPAERLRVIDEELVKAPLTPPGTKYAYSNLGYIIAGAVVEKLTGNSWQKNITDHLFNPLKMTHAGFGGTGTPGELDQPWGHNEFSYPVPGNGPDVDNPPVLGPAGRVHCTLQDWAKFIADQLRGARGEPALLETESYRILHKPPFTGEDALGWITAERDWAGGIALNHCGSNTMNFANAWVAPKRDFAILVCVNQGGDAAFKATDEAVSALIDQYQKSKKDPGK